MSYEHHGDTGTRLHRIWKSMKGRCYLKSWKPYKWYGARGIEVCEDWKNSYLKFREWAIHEGYQDTLELERIDVNGNYEPSNCKWVTHHEQSLNRRDTLYLKFLDTDETYRLYDFCLSNHINYHTLSMWRVDGIADEKLRCLLKRDVTIIGGKKEVVLV